MRILAKKKKCEFSQKKIIGYIYATNGDKIIQGVRSAFGPRIQGGTNIRFTVQRSDCSISVTVNNRDAGEAFTVPSQTHLRFVVALELQGMSVQIIDCQKIY